MLSGHDPFKIGERNVATTFDFLVKNGLCVRHRDTGGSINRTIHLDIGAGSVNMKTPVATQQFSLTS